MAERNIAAEVLDGLREVREHRAGRLALRTTEVPRRSPRTSNEGTGTTRDEGGPDAVGAQERGRSRRADAASTTT